MARRGLKLLRLFQHAGTHLMVIGTDLGHRNGYMHIPNDHPFHAKLMEMSPITPTDWDEISKATGIPVPDSMRERSADPTHRHEVAMYDWMSGQIDIHGSWTFARVMSQQDMDDWVGSDGAPAGIWFGFDTGHYMDGSDEQLMREFGQDEAVIESMTVMNRHGGHVWTTDEVAIELSRAADELHVAKMLAEVTT